MSDTVEKAEFDACVASLTQVARALTLGETDAEAAAAMLVRAALADRAEPAMETGIEAAAHRRRLFTRLLRANAARIASAPAASPAERLATLPRRQREALLLVALARFSYADCAAIMRLDEAAVGALVYEARERLRLAAADVAPGRPPYLRLVK